MFFTDADVESANNIIVHKMKFEEFRQYIQSFFEFPIVLDRPYKLCEYKQAYGYILKDYIKEYDYWGVGDLDLVYGDIRRFITDEVLNFKFILGWGHLTLIHNDLDANTYFMKQVDGYQYYQDAFTTSKITFFDEFNHKGCSDKWCDCRREPDGISLTQNKQRLQEHQRVIEEVLPSGAILDYETLYLLDKNTMYKLMQLIEHTNSRRWLMYCIKIINYLK